jgi:hypothetical protein
VEQVIVSHAENQSAGTTQCIWGVICLIVGLFIFGIPCGFIAAHLGGEGIKNGAGTFGGVVRVGGWVEVVMTIIGLILAVAGRTAVP